jgi:hypothetical protein
MPQFRTKFLQREPHVRRRFICMDLKQLGSEVVLVELNVPFMNQGSGPCWKVEDGHWLLRGGWQ